MCNLVPGVISYPQLHDYGEERKSYLQEVFQVLKNVDSGKIFKKIISVADQGSHTVQKLH